jgi:FtsK/SpoIIIE family
MSEIEETTPQVFQDNEPETPSSTINELSNLSESEINNIFSNVQDENSVGIEQYILKKADVDILIEKYNAFSTWFCSKLDYIQQNYDGRIDYLKKIKTETEEQLLIIQNSLNQYKKASEGHLSTQKVSLPYTSQHSRLTQNINSDTNTLETAQRSVDSANRFHSELLTKKMPDYDGAIIGTLTVIGIVFGCGLGISSNSGAVFLVILVIGIGAGIGLSQIIKHNARESMRYLYSQIRGQQEIGEASIQQHKNILNQNLAQNETTLKFNSQKLIDELNNDAKNKHKNLFNESDSLFMKGGFSVKNFDNPDWEHWKPNFHSNIEKIIPSSLSFGKLFSSIRKRDAWTLFPQESHLYPFVLPSTILLNTGNGLLFDVTSQNKSYVVSAIQEAMLRLLAMFPPGMVRFTMLDPIGLGQNVAAFMPLGKYDDKLITSRAWSEPRHIEKELEQLTLHLQDFIQMRLRNEHKSIEEYNQKSKVPEPYRFLIVFDFPCNFSNEAIRRLISIAENGPRCGVYPIIVVDRELYAKNTPYNFNLNSLSQHLEVISEEVTGFQWKGEDLNNWIVGFPDFNLEREKDIIDRIIKEIGEKSVSAMKVEVPFEELLGEKEITSENLWVENNTTIDSIQISLGPQNVEQMQELVLGKGTSHHSIIIGKTGSGKTNLMDVIITALALKYSPEEIQFYLIDLKKGVGFKPYSDARLPHAKVIAIDSEREFALSVLRGLINEMDNRGDIFRNYSVDSIKAFREKTQEKIPRILLVVDEFQNLFLEDDPVSRESSLILERLTREGRSFGIHILLGSQSLAGKASNLSSATLGQIGIRVALMCNESDARAIMADDNPEARLLSRPGEAIYNNQNGLIEGNKRFQVALFGDDARQKYLKIISKRAKSGNYKKPTVFEGNQLAKLEECETLEKILTGEVRTSKKIQAWLGEPIKLSNEPTLVNLRKQAGNNLLIVAREENEGVGMLASAWVSLALRHKPSEADFYFLNFTNSEEKWHELINEFGEMLPHCVKKLDRRNLLDIFSKLTKEIDDRVSENSSNTKNIYITIFGLQRAKDLRFEDNRFGSYGGEKEPGVSELFSKILKEGAEVGVHVLVWCDLVNNVKRTLDRKAINEFNFRVASQMSQDDSQFILDNSAASKLDRPHRAIFYDEDRPGYLDKFRPFSIPSEKEWWKNIVDKLSGFHGEE